MTPDWVLFIAVVFGAAASIAFYSGYLYGHRDGYSRGWRASRRIRVVRDEPTEVTVAESGR